MDLEMRNSKLCPEGNVTESLRLMRKDKGDL